jgi:hypothetical protein
MKDLFGLQSSSIEHDLSYVMISFDFVDVSRFEYVLKLPNPLITGILTVEIFCVLSFELSRLLTSISSALVNFLEKKQD